MIAYHCVLRVLKTSRSCSRRQTYIFQIRMTQGIQKWVQNNQLLSLPNGHFFKLLFSVQKIIKKMTFLNFRRHFWNKSKSSNISRCIQIWNQRTTEKVRLVSRRWVRERSLMTSHIEVQGISYWSVKSNSVLRGKRTNHFIELWLIVGSGGLEIWVNRISWEKFEES